jgi:calcineurin-like phosphoesterase family protein
MRRRGDVALRAALAVVVLVLALGTGALVAAQPDRPQADPVIVAAGDIAGGSKSGSWVQTANLIGTINPKAVISLGDNQYPDGALSDYRAFYDRSWGKYLGKTNPAPGNHEYDTANAKGYFDYFGSRAPSAYYSYDIGEWHLVSLNSEIDYSTGSAQETWLDADLAVTTKKCILAYWHRPRWSSGDEHGSDSSLDPLVTDLYHVRADLLLVRFARQNPDGEKITNGIREVVVGTGGKSHYGFGPAIANSQARNSSSFGLLKVTLHPASYDLEFVPTTGSFTDKLTDVSCH